MGDVVKRSGKRQTFSGAKLRKSIERAAKEAKLKGEVFVAIMTGVADPAIKFFAKKRVVKAADIRKSVLGRLSRRKKSVASVWKRYEKKK